MAADTKRLHHRLNGAAKCKGRGVAARFTRIVLRTLLNPGLYQLDLARCQTCRRRRHDFIRVILDQNLVQLTVVRLAGLHIPRIHDRRVGCQDHPVLG